MRKHRLFALLEFSALCALACAGCTIETRAAPTSPRVLLLDAAISGREIVAVGERGQIHRSTDSGATWIAIESGVSATLTGVAFTTDGALGWAVGHDALILATEDGGRTW